MKVEVEKLDCMKCHHCPLVQPYRHYHASSSSSSSCIHHHTHIHIGIDSHMSD